MQDWHERAAEEVVAVLDATEAAVTVQVQTPPASVFVGVPHYGSLVPEVLRSIMTASTEAQVHVTTNGASLLAHNFNILWCSALNKRAESNLTHFAMHHADILAEACWLDKLLEEMRRVEADVISVVVPIKDSRGLTSTGMQDPQTMNIRRLTMAEIMDLPVTFDAEDTRKFWEDDNPRWLMVNTGLFLVDFTKPWVEESYFEIRDAIRRGEDGRFSAHVLSEDWHWSGMLARKGLRVFATRAVHVVHYGRADFHNNQVWGCATDPGG